METSWSGVVIGDGPSPLLMSCRKRVEGRERERERREIERERERERLRGCSVDPGSSSMESS